MAANIEVILREDVAHLGKAGDVVRVKPGYARNYLIPRALAVSATRGNLDRTEHDRAAVMARVAKLRKTAEQVANALAPVTVTLQKPAGEGDKLYGSVNNREVAEALGKQGFEIDRKKIELPGTIKELGEYEVSVKLGSEVTATFKLVVEKQE
jgi:large subunit ribosomal protein L9